MELMTVKEVADLLRFKDHKAAKRKMQDLGVQPFFLGNGRGRGFRYEKSEVIEAIRKTRVNLRTRKKPVERTLMDDLSDGKITVSQAADILMSG